MPLLFLVELICVLILMHVQPETLFSATDQSLIETFAKPVSPKVMKTKLDIATMRLYSNALDEIDRKNPDKAIKLLKQVLAKYPDFEPARRNLEKLSRQPKN